MCAYISFFILGFSFSDVLVVAMTRSSYSTGEETNPVSSVPHCQSRVRRPRWFAMDSNSQSHLDANVSVLADARNTGPKIKAAHGRPRSLLRGNLY